MVNADHIIHVQKYDDYRKVLLTRDFILVRESINEIEGLINA